MISFTHWVWRWSICIWIGRSKAFRDISKFWNMERLTWYLMTWKTKIKTTYHFKREIFFWNRMNKVIFCMLKTTNLTSSLSVIRITTSQSNSNISLKIFSTTNISKIKMIILIEIAEFFWKKFKLYLYIRLIYKIC